jgi:hypothetical protein
MVYTYFMIKKDSVSNLGFFYCQCSSSLFTTIAVKIAVMDIALHLQVLKC